MTAPQIDLSELSVLMVEDSFQALTLAKQMLQDLGLKQIVTARDGMEALRFLGAVDDEGFVDIVLCDWNMPRMSGMELLRQIRTCDPDLPFLMITGMADYESVMEAKAYGVTGYLRKPFSAVQLGKKLTLVARLIAHRRSH